jgi:PEP-CTERM motif
MTCASCQSAPSPQNQQFDAGTFAFNAPLVLGATPEPGSLLLLAIGITSIAGMIHRKICG